MTETNLEITLDRMQREKDTKLIPENIRKGVNIFGVPGTLNPVNIEGGDTGMCLYQQTEAPTQYDGIWLNTDKTANQIYLETERYTEEHSIMYSNYATDDPSNIIRHIKQPSSFLRSQYAQFGNVVHFFGYYDTTTSKNTSDLTQQHYKYDFNTNTWTKLTDCPLPFGSGACIWYNDKIYLIGSNYQESYNTIYKYDITTDSFELACTINDEHFSTSLKNTTLAAIDDNENIWIHKEYSLFKYSIKDNTVEYKGNLNYDTSLDSIPIFVYFDNKIFYSYPSTSTSFYLNTYDIISESDVSSGWGEVYAGKTLWLDSKHLAHVNSTNLMRGTLKIYDFEQKTSVFSKSIDYESLDDSVPMSLFILNYPLCLFKVSDTMDILWQPVTCLRGITNSTSTDDLNSTAFTFQDKVYEFTEDTLIFNVTEGGNGKYKTELYKSNNILNGGMPVRFSDVDYYDKANEKIIKDIQTYYGDGEKWVKIK